ncbi:protein kinase domain-containing protein [Actinocorallia aurantiaca]|uniref:Protein kinase domain-containing protein n=1 Tax=Actinocorallia aurantiaca TaxID=46204 RepID=A0ABN3TS55_9ACTN
MRPFEPGDPGLVGGLWLSGRLGEGPLGVVFLGQQADGTKVAVKLLHAHLTEDPAIWESYQGAMEAVVRISVPNTARALSTGLVGARPFLMSEYVEGIPLPDIPEPFSAAELERLAVRTATALAGLHAAGIPHGALRPSNVIMSAQGAVLTDYGLTPGGGRALSADLPDWARLVQSAAGEQELPPRLRTLTEACLSAVPPSASELLRQLTAPSSDPGVTVAELAAPPAAFGRPAPEPEIPAEDGPQDLVPPRPEEPEAPRIELTVTAFDSPLGPPPMASDPANPVVVAAAMPAADQTVFDPVSPPVAEQTMFDSVSPPSASGSGWAMETRVEPMPGALAEPGPMAGPGPMAEPAFGVPEAAPLPQPPAPSFDVPPPWAGEGSDGRGAKRSLLVVAASVTVALLLVGVFAVTRGGGEADPQPVAAKTGIAATEQPTAEPAPTEQPSEIPTAPAKSQKNGGSPTPKPKKTATPTPTPSKKKPKPPRNLLTNNGFESGFGKWEPRAATFIGAKAAHSGKRAVLLQAGNGYDAAVEYVATGLKPNTAYVVVGWVTADVGATFIGAKDFGPESRYVSSGSKKWTRLSVTFKTGGGTTARIYCWRDVPGNGACDDMALYRR